MDSTLVSIGNQILGGSTSSALLGGIVSLLLLFALKKPIISAFIRRNSAYIRPVVLELLKIMETINNYAYLNGEEKEKQVMVEYKNLLENPLNKTITSKSTKWIKYFGGTEFIIRNILYPSIKYFIKKK